MDRLEEYRQLIQKIIVAHTEVPYTDGEITFETFFDREADRYLLMLVGWEASGKRVHGSLIHIDILDGKIWIQRDGTEYGVARELLDAGVPKEDIVLAFHPPEVRQDAELTAA
jgi:hypothetical protein